MNDERLAVVLIGDPIAHSVSPPMHQAAFEAAGLPFVYSAVRVSPADLPAAFARLRQSAAGLNVTAPLKSIVMPLLDAVDPGAAAAGSVNTVRFKGEDSWGASTDGEGFLEALSAAGLAAVGEAVVLGWGGAARAVVAALASRGTAVTIAGRNIEAAGRVAADISASLNGSSYSAELRHVAFEPQALAPALSRADLLVNATPVGGWPEGGASPILEPQTLHSELTVFDLVYRPRRTHLLADALARGCRVVEGIEMLIRQGAKSFEMWTGRAAPVEVMREAALRAIREEPQQSSTVEHGRS